MPDYLNKSRFRRRFVREFRNPHLGRRVSTYRSNRMGRPRKKIPRTVVPSFFTLMNLFCGFISVIQTHQGNYKAAAWLIVLAGLFDLFDGMVARMANATSLFGVELDSLADVVSFGLAPSFLVYVFGLEQLHEAGLIIAALPALAGAVRLARFNTDFDGEKHLHFTGLPIPAQALAIVSFILTFNEIDLNPYFQFGKLSIMVPLVIILSLLMVSNIKFASLPKPSIRSFREMPRLWAGYAICALLILFLHEIGIFLSMVLYLLTSMVLALVHIIQAIWAETATSDETT